eukprot:8848917-Ditylum_brightwellii.AAC.1
MRFSQHTRVDLRTGVRVLLWGQLILWTHCPPNRTSTPVLTYWAFAIFTKPEQACKRMQQNHKAMKQSHEAGDRACAILRVCGCLIGLEIAMMCTVGRCISREEEATCRISLPKIYVLASTCAMNARIPLKLSAQQD